MEKQSLRSRALDVLGNKCVNCGFSDKRALQIDHIRGDGAIERRSARHAQAMIYKFIIAEPHLARGRYQILCANCNCIKAHRNGEWSGKRTREVQRERYDAKKLWGYTPRELENVVEHQTSHRTMRALATEAELDAELARVIGKD